MSFLVYLGADSNTTASPENMLRFYANTIAVLCVLCRCPLEAHPLEGLAETRQFVFNPATQIGVGIDPGVTQAVSAASGVWDMRSGQLVADQLAQWKLTKPHLQHLAAASSAGTFLVANLKHITVTLATWDAVWEEYLDPK
ncbi:hypothetical protein QJQ45_005179 [Haematococcus lacustris]|nr:hypothetical protein QJQ45_005179 [Haematococcus lacustris]